MGEAVGLRTPDLTIRTYVDRDLTSSGMALQASLRAGHAAAQRVTRQLWTLAPPQ